MTHKCCPIGNLCCVWIRGKFISLGRVLHIHQAFLHEFVKTSGTESLHQPSVLSDDKKGYTFPSKYNVSFSDSGTWDKKLLCSLPSPKQTLERVWKSSNGSVSLKAMISHIIKT